MEKINRWFDSFDLTFSKETRGIRVLTGLKDRVSVWFNPSTDKALLPVSSRVILSLEILSSTVALEESADASGGTATNAHSLRAHEGR